jgi:16S rRNA (guanine(966)-N(2))-methyltransferase RsmD
MDRVKEACFSIIGRNIINAVFLDLFAGTGSVGIEALSRGASLAVFVELDRLAIQTIHTNLQITGLVDRAVVRRMSTFDFLKGQPETDVNYIYIAPPQYEGLWQKTLALLDNNPQWLVADTIVIVQIDPSEQQPITLQHLEPYDERRYGKTLLWFFASSKNTADVSQVEEQ